MKMVENKKGDLNKIKLLATDVDGVLTDGSIVVSADGVESKRFNLLDGHGIKMWQRAGLDVAFISGRESKVTKLRADELGVKYLYQPCRRKLKGLEKLLDESGVELENIAYVGDDVLDIPVARRVGFSAAVANAVDELKSHVSYVTSRKGGCGAIREVVEYILKNTGRWDALMERYLV